MTGQPLTTKHDDLPASAEGGSAASFNRGASVEGQAMQRHDDLAVLMNEAAVARPYLVQELQEMAAAFGCDYEVGPLKSIQRAADKIDRKYNGNVGHLCDICRGMLIVDDDKIDVIRALADNLDPAVDERVKHRDDRMSKPTSSGFRSLNISIAMPNDHIVEIMILTRGMRRAYDQTHDLYEKASALSGMFKSAADTDGVVNTDQKREVLLAQARDIHERATSKALREFKL